VVVLIKLLGDFSIDELPDISLTKREMVILAYLLTKRQEVYLRELAELFSFDGSSDEATIKKILRNLSKKLDNFVSLKLSNYKVFFETALEVDVNILEDELLKLSKKKTEISDAIVKIINIYRGHFLPFIDNVWVNSFRNALKNYLLRVISEYFYNDDNHEINIEVDLKILKLLPELYINDSVEQIHDYLKSSKKVNFGLGGNNKTDGTVAIRAVRLNHNLMDRIIRYSDRIDLINPEEFVIFIEEEKLKSLSNCKVENVNLY